MKNILGIALGLAFIDFLTSFLFYSVFFILTILGIVNGALPGFDLNLTVMVLFWTLFFIYRILIIRYLARTHALPRPITTSNLLIISLTAIVLESIVLSQINIPVRELLIYSVMGFILIFHSFNYVKSNTTSQANTRQIGYQILIALIITILLQLILNGLK